MGNTLAWVRFQQVFGCGTTRGQKLLTRLGRPSALFEMPKHRLASILKPGEMERLQREGSEEKAQEILDRCCDLGCQVLTPDDADYPQRLREVYGCPSALYVWGSLADLDDCLAIGMVGTRRCTAYGEQAAELISGELAKKGAVIVSGLARGIDTVSHAAALRAGGRTVAVLGCGIDVTYPPENAHLKELIVRYGGAVVTEYPPGTPPLPRHFPIRNRIISGLSNGVVVVEGNRHSGSLITAGHAFAQNRDVFAVPGSIFSEVSAGPNYLLRQNAIPVDGVESILEEYQYLIRWEPAGEPSEKTAGGKTTSLFEELEQNGYNDERKAPPPAAKGGRRPAAPVQETLPAYLTEAQQKVYGALAEGGEQAADEIVRGSGLPLPAVLSALTQLEIFGLVKTHPGKRFSLS